MSAEMLKGHLDAIILSSLDAGEAHGYAIIETINRRSRGTFDLAEGTVYPALHRLENSGFLESRWVTWETGRRRRMYALTPSGRASLQERHEIWQNFSEAVESFLGPRAQCPS